MKPDTTKQKKKNAVAPPAPSGEVTTRRAHLPKAVIAGAPEFETLGDLRPPLERKRTKKLHQDVPAIQQKQMTFGDQGGSVSWRVFRIMSEYVDGFEFLSKLEHTVTFFGSARLPETSPYYQKARELAYRLATAGYTIVTGGGPGIMEAGNRGAAEAGGKSVGFVNKLPSEQVVSSFLKRRPNSQFHCCRPVFQG